jgi:VWFA-related protein
MSLRMTERLWRTRVTGAAVALALVLAVRAPSVRAQGAQQQPTFRAGTELVLIDTQVAGRDGTPIQGLKPEDFEVFLDGKKRAVVSAELVKATAAATGPAPATAPETFRPDGRVIVMAIDQGSFPMMGRPAAREAATRILERVAPDDYLGMIAFPGTTQVPPSRDRAAIREAISRITGLRVDANITSRYNLSATDASQIKSNDSVAITEIIARECRAFPPDPSCPMQLKEDASVITTALEQQAMLSLDGLYGAIDAVASIPGRKTLVVVSAGIPMSNRPGGRPNFDAESAKVARRAAAANLNLYVFYMNVHFLQYFSASYNKRNHTIFDDITMFGLGLEKFSDGAGGSFTKIEVDSNPSVDRMLRETSAIYVVAVRAEAAERDGKEHFIRVVVKRGGSNSTVRYRRIVVIPSGG